MSLADEIARTLKVPATITRLPDAPVPEDRGAEADTRTRTRTDDASALKRLAGITDTPPRSGWHTFRPRATADGFVPPAPLPRAANDLVSFIGNLRVTSFATDAPSSGALTKLHARRVRAAYEAVKHGTPTACTFTRPDGSEVTAWTYAAGSYVYAERDTLRARASIPRLVTDRERLILDSSGLVATFQSWRPEFSALQRRTVPARLRDLRERGIAPVRVLRPLPNPTNLPNPRDIRPSAIVRDLYADILATNDRERILTAEIKRLRDLRDSVERRERRAAARAAETPDEREARKARDREAARARREAESPEAREARKAKNRERMRARREAARAA